MKPPRWLSAALVQAIHGELMAEFGGLAGRVDEDALNASLARPQQRHHDGNPPPTLIDLAASYGFAFARNHAFSDGNKRVALAAIDVFLQLNGRELTAPEMEAVVTIQALAAGKLDEKELSRWITTHSAKRPTKRQSQDR